MRKAYCFFSSGLTVASVAAATLLVGTTTFVQPASAACKQTFVNTTCSGWGSSQKCTNHFAQVCDGQAILAPNQGGRAGGAGGLNPGIGVIGGGNVRGIVAGNTSRLK